MTSLTSVELIFILGAMMLFGHIVGALFRKINLPDLVGIIFAGVIIKFVLNTILKMEDFTHQLISSFVIVISIALGLEAFSIGSEMVNEEDKPKLKFGKLVALQAAFVIVFTLLGLLIMKDVKFAILIGAITAATAPIALIELFDTYDKSKRITRGLSRMISFDNIIAIAYFFIVFSITNQPGNITLIDTIDALLGLVITIIIGSLVGFILYLVNRHIISKLNSIQKRDNAYIFFVISIVVMLITGYMLLGETQLFEKYYISQYVVTFVAGTVFGNLIPREDNHHQVEVIHNFIPPLLTVFFVIVGMELDFSSLFGRPGIFLIVYIVAMIILKTIFSYIEFKKYGKQISLSSFTPFAVITKSSFEVYLAHLAMISLDEGNIFTIILISILLFETLEPHLITKSKINKMHLTIK